MPIASSSPVPDLNGESRAIEAVRVEAAFAARSDAKVLITGESGVGKEIVAHLIHASSARRFHPLVTVNCAGLTETLLETELFGHVRGSFTGAYRDRAGLFEQAHRGTVFMDEIGETTPRMQGLLLRFLETGEIQRVGADGPDKRVDVRIIAATNRNLLDSVHEKLFREDLYYRLNVIHLIVPPLRERREDVAPLFVGFLHAFARQYRLETPVVSNEALDALVGHSWPGNVRELKNCAERLIVKHREGRIEASDVLVEIPGRAARSSAGVPMPQAVSRADALFERIVSQRESFWASAYPLFMARDMTRDELRALVGKGLEQTAGNYRLLMPLFNMPESDYKRFLNFLRKHQCHVAFQPFRSAAARALAAERTVGSANVPRPADWRRHVPV